MASSVAEAMEAGFLPALDEDQANMFTPLELQRLYQHAQDHRLLTRDILGYPSLFGDILGSPLISKLSRFQVDSAVTAKIQRAVTRPAAAARQPGAEMNERYGIEYLCRDIRG